MTDSSVRKHTFATPWLIAGVSFFLIVMFFTGLKQMPGFVNDEAVEILQSRDMPFDRYHLFTPQYRNGFVDEVESTIPYLVHATESLFGQSLISIRLVYFVSLCGAIWIFSRETRRFAGAFAGNLAIVLTATSSYILFYNRVMTRNGFSFLWTVLLIVVLLRIAESPPGAPFNRWILLYLPLTGLLAITSYSAYKLIIPGIYCMLFLSALSGPSRWKRLTAISCSLSIFSSLLFILIQIGGTSLDRVLMRGSYVLNRSDSPIVSIGYNLFFSFLQPFMHLAKGRFVIDITHGVFNRHSLSWWLAPFFLIGIAAIVRNRATPEGRQGRCILAGWMASTAFVSVSGPSLKHLFATFPFILLIVILGLKRSHAFLRERSGNRMANVLIIGVCSLVCVSELYHLTRVIPNSPVLNLEVHRPREVAAVIRTIAREGPVVFAEDFAKDAVRLHTRDIAGISYLPYHRGITSELLIQIASHHDVIRIISFDKGMLKLFEDFPELLACFDIHEQKMNDLEFREYTLRADCPINWTDLII